MRYLSLCSGIEAASVAWHPLGWEAAAFSEIDPFASAVLKHRFPSVPNLGDMTHHEQWNIEPRSVDIMVGGTPCQPFSLAGLRTGMADPRGNLALTYLAIVDRLRPEWVVYENVPGLLSSNGGRDFGTFLGAMAELGYGFAYRVLDAQYFGTRQRRRRVFVVANATDWRRAAAVLFEPESLRGDSGQVNEEKERDTDRSTVEASTEVGRTRTGLINGKKKKPWILCKEGCEDFYCQIHKMHVSDCDCPPIEEWAERGLWPYDACKAKDLWFLDAEAAEQHEEARLFRLLAFGYYAEDGTASTLKFRDYKDATDLVLQDSRVRRLTPTESERLQGFPDDWTAIPYEGKQASDTNRYKVVGNSMAVPVIRWIGERIEAVQKAVEAR